MRKLSSLPSTGNSLKPLPPLEPQQVEGISRLTHDPVNHRRIFLAFEPGLGKTRITVEAVDKLKLSQVLVICPAIARAHWKSEFLKWSPRRDLDIVIVSYDLLSRASLPRDKFPPKFEPEVIILDECHKLKTHNSNRTRKIYGVRTNLDPTSKGIIDPRTNPFVWLLSGTPAPNNVGELWTHIHALWPQSIIGGTLHPQPLTRTQFEDRFCTISTTFFGRTITGSKDVGTLRQLMSGYFYPKRLSQCNSTLPPLIFREFVLPRDDVDLATLLQIDARLAPFANDPDPVEAIRGAGTHVAVERSLLGLLKAPLVVELAYQELGSNPRLKVVIFFQHTQVGKLIAKSLNQFHPAYIDGSVPDPTRVMEIQRFQEDPLCQVFVGQIQATGEAITLTSASEVIFAEPSWVPTQNFQAAKRLHRIGQTRPVRARFCVLENSMDQKIMSAVARKTRGLVEVMK